MHLAPDRKDIVLVGGGHTHVLVLKAFGLNPVPGVRLTLIAKELAAPYSGMLPGFVAGHYALDECEIDLVRLAKFSGAQIVHGAVTGVDRKEKRVLIEGCSPLRYDLLSLNVGVTPDLDDIAGAAEHALVVKPVSEFAAKWQNLEAHAAQGEGPRRFVVIGGGAAGVELILAARHRLIQIAQRSRINPVDFSFTLVAGGAILEQHASIAQKLAKSALRHTGITSVENDPAVAVGAANVALQCGRLIGSDATLISTRARAPQWFGNLDFPRSAAGFIAVRPTLQVYDDDDVFAAGDCADMVEHPRAKSGVFAVRQGPILAENLRRRAVGQSLRSFIPQRKSLSIISLGERRAIAARGEFVVSGRWAWRLKDWIDRAFMNQFKNLEAAPSRVSAQRGHEDTRS
ncbi:MAG: FAD-dependent oxidoreductase [Hyphomicrobium sp.]